MRVSWSRRSAKYRPASTMAMTLLSLSLIVPFISAINFAQVSQPNIDFSDLGRVGIAGDFSGISIYEYEGQSEMPYSTNGSESLMAQLPNGVFKSLLGSDAVIRSMCQLPDSKDVILGGDFTSLDGNRTQSLAIYMPSTSTIETINGLDGQVNSLYCDTDDTVYIGGNFKTNKSMNAIIWSKSGGLKNLQFAGFNGPVNAIAKASNDHIIFGGAFTGLGNASLPTELDGQAINLLSGNISAQSTTTSQTSYTDPSSVLCRANNSSSRGWLLEDNTAGYWQADLGFAFRPTKLRMWNTNIDGRGTKTWRFTALPLNGILNMTYLDSNGQNVSCTSECPLSSNSSDYQDFHFVNIISMNSFRIDISAWYGSGGGFNGIEIFQDDITSYAINDFNEPSCIISSSIVSKSTTSGTWSTITSDQTSSQYLSSTTINSSVTFYPDIRETGNYTVNIYTPGCLQDNSCSTRGQVNITGIMTTDGDVAFSTTLYQTNNYDKYDQIYFGYVDTSDDNFRPSVTLSGIQGSTALQTVVAQRVGFILINSTGGLNGLYDFDPNASVSSLKNFESSVVNKLGSSFGHGSAVFDIAVAGDLLFTSGNFSTSSVKNVAFIDTESNITSTMDGGVNGRVVSMHIEGTTLYLGGSFNNTAAGNATGLSNVASFNTASDTWTALGAGVNGPVDYVVAMDISVVSGITERVIAFTGNFNSCLAFNTYHATDVNGLAVWVPSQKNWIQNLKGYPRYDGLITASVNNVTDVGSLVAGSITSSSMGASGAATLTDGTLGAFSIHFLNGTSDSTTLSTNTTKRVNLDEIQSSGVITGAFYSSDKRNLTILAGHFTAVSANGSSVQNLAIIDGDNNDVMTGLGDEIDDSSVFSAVAVNNDLLFAGGRIAGKVGDSEVSGFISYDLSTGRLSSSQPPGLIGTNMTINSIRPRPDSTEIYVGGTFTSAGSLPCPGVCMWDASQSQWNQPGTSLKGEVHSMIWNSDSTLLVGGDLRVNDTQNTSLALYNVKTAAWDVFADADTALPGTVSLITAGSDDVSQFWVAGYTEHGAFYLIKYDGSDWISASPDDIQTGSVLSSLQVFATTKKHTSNAYLDDKQVLVITGSINLRGFGPVSAVVFDGTNFSPYSLSVGSENNVGFISRIFVQTENFFTSNSGHMRLVFVVLIGLAISLGLVLLIVAAGILLNYTRKKREGYVPAPTAMFDRGSGLQRVPPQQLLEFLERGGSTAPRV